MRSLFARLKLAHKLLICSAAFALPVGLPLYFTVSGFERQIQFTAREISGAGVLQPLCRLAVLLSAQKRVAPGEVQSLIAEIREMEPRFGPLITAEPAGKTGADLARQVYAAFPRLSESSKLILDPDLDSYYLSDIALVRLPEIHKALSRDPRAVVDPVSLDRVRHAASVVLTEKRRKHTDGVLSEAEVSRALSSVETTGGAQRLETASMLWQTCAADLMLLLKARAAALRRDELMALVLTLVAVLFATALLFFVLRNVSIPLTRATRIAEKIAEGRVGAAEASLARPAMLKYLRTSATGNGHMRDEAIRLVEAFARMTKNLDSLLNEVRKSCSNVDGSTAAIAAALRQLEASVAEQAASTNQVAATGKEIFATVDRLAQTMRAVTAMAGEAAKLAEGGVTGLAGINTAMQDMLQGVGSVSRVLGAISTEAANIQFVLGAITKIANHTNLISLNAAIEAEKAGEHAAGFTSVSLEIRRVADQTAIAALDIERMLRDMQTAASEGVRTMEEYARRSQENCQTVTSITVDLGRSIECTRRLEPHFEAVNSGMQMQAQAARQILEAMQQLSAAAAQTRESLAQFREISEHMRAMVDVLQSEVGRFSAE